MNIGGYSAFSKELAKEQLQDIKRKTKAEQIIRKQKIKHLSNQTNEFRRKHEEKKKVHEGDEEKRRLRILKMRKIRQDSATEKFQRKPEKKTPIVKPEAKPSSLKDGNYNVAGHVIEIRNGVRVPSANGRRNTAQEPEQNNLVHVHQQKFQNTVYQPDSYLNHHLKNLFGDDRITEKQYSNRPVPSQQNIPPSLPNHHPDSMNIPSSGTTSTNQDILFIDRKSPTDSLCSNDSLHESPLEQKLLRSSLKGSSALKMASSSTKSNFFR
ncbi:uncharacterized protein [Clytia hemisphaerica]|uniref:uncharacterized protein n=1 Tax=Clytia hemisphaerica TaxID=252671 RepID=UPI0034D67C81